MPEQPDSQHADTEVVFLGVCDRAGLVFDPATGGGKWNALGLRHYVISALYPISLIGLHLAFAIRYNIGAGFRIEIIGPRGSPVGEVTMEPRLEGISGGEHVSAFPPPQAAETWIATWIPTFADMATTDLLIETPGLYTLRHSGEPERGSVGQIDFLQGEAKPLTPERMAAIRSDAFAAKFVRVDLGCKFCTSKLRAYAGLQRSEEQERGGAIWYEALPDHFLCDCKRTELDVTSYRRNLHVLVGSQLRGNTPKASFLPLYERSALQDLRQTFLDMIDRAPAEESVQQFIEANPVLLHQFPAVQIFSKPSILGMRYADFAILTPQKELLLIELEKPALQLMTRNGGIAAPLTHAFDQVREWLRIADDHRLAVLEALHLEKAQVSKVSGVVIAGRDHGYDAHHLRMLKGHEPARTRMLTYDDLIGSMDALVRTFAQVT